MKPSSNSIDAGSSKQQPHCHSSSQTRPLLEVGNGTLPAGTPNTDNCKAGGKHGNLSQRSGASPKPSKQSRKSTSPQLARAQEASRSSLAPLSNGKPQQHVQKISNVKSGGVKSIGVTIASQSQKVNDIQRPLRSPKQQAGSKQQQRPASPMSDAVSGSRENWVGSASKSPRPNSAAGEPQLRADSLHQGNKPQGFLQDPPQRRIGAGGGGNNSDGSSSVSVRKRRATEGTASSSQTDEAASLSGASKRKRVATSLASPDAKISQLAAAADGARPSKSLRSPTSADARSGPTIPFSAPPTTRVRQTETLVDVLDSSEDEIGTTSARNTRSEDRRPTAAGVQAQTQLPISTDRPVPAVTAARASKDRSTEYLEVASSHGRFSVWEELNRLKKNRISSPEDYMVAVDRVAGAEQAFQSLRDKLRLIRQARLDSAATAVNVEEPAAEIWTLQPSRPERIGEDITEAYIQRASGYVAEHFSGAASLQPPFSGPGGPLPPPPPRLQRPGLPPPLLRAKTPDTEEALKHAYRGPPLERTPWGNFLGQETGELEVEAMMRAVASQPLEHWDARDPRRPRPTTRECIRRVAALDFTRRLHEEIAAFVTWCEPTRWEVRRRCEVLARVSIVARTLWPSCQVLPFGSFATGLVLPEGDVDVCLMEVPCLDNAEACRDLAAALKKCRFANKLTAITKARIPIVKYIDDYTGLSVDISFNQESSIETSDFIRIRLAEWPELRPLVITLKMALRQLDLGETYTGGIGSYMLFTMALFHFQMLKKEILFRRKQYPDDPEAAKDPNLGELLLGFLRRFSEWNYFDDGIDVRQDGRVFDKHKVPHRERDAPDLLCISSPLEPETDIGKNSFKVQGCVYAFTRRLARLKSAHYYEAHNPQARENSILAGFLSIDDRVFRRRMVPREHPEYGPVNLRGQFTIYELRQLPIVDLNTCRDVYLKIAKSLERIGPLVPLDDLTGTGAIITAYEQARRRRGYIAAEVCQSSPGGSMSPSSAIDSSIDSKRTSRQPAVIEADEGPIDVEESAAATENRAVTTVPFRNRLFNVEGILRGAVAEHTEQERLRQQRLQRFKPSSPVASWSEDTTGRYQPEQQLPRLQWQQRPPTGGPVKNYGGMEQEPGGGYQSRLTGNRVSPYNGGYQYQPGSQGPPPPPPVHSGHSRGMGFSINAIESANLGRRHNHTLEVVDLSDEERPPLPPPPAPPAGPAPPLPSQRPSRRVVVTSHSPRAPNMESPRPSYGFSPSSLAQAPSLPAGSLATVDSDKEGANSDNAAHSAPVPSNVISVSDSRDWLQCSGLRQISVAGNSGSHRRVSMPSEDLAQGRTVPHPVNDSSGSASGDSDIEIVDLEDEASAEAVRHLKETSASNSRPLPWD